MPGRAEFQTLANKRLDEAKTLHGAGHYEAAFYLAGYAVEYGLKAAICKTLQVDIFNMPKDLHTGFKTHRLDHLTVLSGLSTKLEIDIVLDSSLLITASPFLTPPLGFENWQSWSEQVRYNTTPCPEQVSQEFINNVGYFISWLKNHW